MSISVNDQVSTTAMKSEQKLVEIKGWMDSQVKWKGRTDDDFITIFLRSCDFDVEKTKKTLSIHYENRMKIPQWYTNRHLKDPIMVSVIHQRIAAILDGKIPDFPSVIITTFSRDKVGSDKHLTNPIMKMGLVVCEVLMHRPNCQLNGLIWVLDCRDHPWWPMWELLSPSFISNFINCYYLGMPIKIKKIVAINASKLVPLFYNLTKPFLPQQLRDSIHILGSDYSSLPELVPVQSLPEEYGGEAGPMRDHEDACINEIFTYAEYFAEDDKYGFH